MVAVKGQAPLNQRCSETKHQAPLPCITLVTCDMLSYGMATYACHFRLCPDLPTPLAPPLLTHVVIRNVLLLKPLGPHLLRVTRDPIECINAVNCSSTTNTRGHFYCTSSPNQ